MPAVSYYRCPTCNALVWHADGHRCPPLWECCDPEESPDDWITVHAADAEDAARDFAEQSDDNAADYSRDERVVHVRQPGGTEVLVFNVSMEWERTYSASQEETV